MLKIALLAVLLAAGARGPREGRDRPALHPASRNTIVAVQGAAPAVAAPALVVLPAGEAPAVAADHAPPCPADPLCFFNDTASLSDIPPRYP